MVGAHTQVRLERHDAGREPREDDRQVGTLGLGGLLRELLVFARATEALGHVVEGVHEKAHFIVRGHRQACIEVALRDGACPLDEVLDGLHQPLGGENRAIPGREQRQQQHDRQRQDEARLERPSEIVLLAVLLVGGLHRVRERAQALGHRVHGLHQEPLAARHRGPELHGRAHQVAAVHLRFEAHERPALPDLQQQLVGQLLGNEVRGKSLGERDQGAALGRDREFVCADLLAQGLEEARIRAAARRQLVGDELGVGEMLAHPHLERRTRQDERVVEAAADLDVEPAVDAAVQKLHGKEIHEQDRQRCKHAEDPYHPRLDPRADDVPAPVTHQLRQLCTEQHQQDDETRDVHHQDPGMQAPELLGVLRGLRHEQDRREP